MLVGVQERDTKTARNGDLVKQPEEDGEDSDICAECGYDSCVCIWCNRHGYAHPFSGTTCGWIDL